MVGYRTFLSEYWPGVRFEMKGRLELFTSAERGGEHWGEITLHTLDEFRGREHLIAGSHLVAEFLDGVYEEPEFAYPLQSEEVAVALGHNATFRDRLAI